MSFPLKIAQSHWAIRTPSIHASLGPPKSQPKWHLDHFNRFCTAHSRTSLCFTMGTPFSPANCPLSWGSGLHLKGLHDSFGPSEPTTQTASRLVQPFFAQLTAEYLYTLQWAAPPPPAKLSLTMGDLDFHLVHGFLGPPES